METGDFVLTTMNLDEKILEEGEIQDEVTREGVIPVMTEEHADRVEVEESMGVQKSHCENKISPSIENNQVIDVESIKDEYNNEAVNHPPIEENQLNLSNTKIDPDPHGSIKKLAIMGCFGPFPSGEGITLPIGPSLPLDPSNAQNVMSRYESGSTADKLRRINRTTCTKSPSKKLSIDINSPNIILPEQIPLPDSPNLILLIDETRKTVEIGQILGFEIKSGDPILTEVMEEEGEICIPQ